MSMRPGASRRGFPPCHCDFALQGQARQSELVNPSNLPSATHLAKCRGLRERPLVAAILSVHSLLRETARREMRLLVGPQLGDRAAPMREPTTSNQPGIRGSHAAVAVWCECIPRSL